MVIFICTMLLNNWINQLKVTLIVSEQGQEQ